MSFLESIAPLDESDSRPLYLQLERALRDMVERCELNEADTLPPERDIARVLGVSRITVRKALDGLEQDGLIQRRRGAGTFVSRRVRHDLNSLSSFTADTLANGGAPRTHWLERIACIATPDDTFAFGMAPGTPIFRLNRIRFADDVPMAIEHTIVPAEALATIDAVEDSLYDAMRDNGFRPARALQRLRAILFDEQQAQLLDVAPNAPGLLVERRSFDASGRLIEVTRSYCRGDSYDFVSELQIRD